MPLLPDNQPVLLFPASPRVTVDSRQIYLTTTQSLNEDKSNPCNIVWKSRDGHEISLFKKLPLPYHYHHWLAWHLAHCTISMKGPFHFVIVHNHEEYHDLPSNGDMFSNKLNITPIRMTNKSICSWITSTEDQIPTSQR